VVGPVAPVQAAVVAVAVAPLPEAAVVAVAVAPLPQVVSVAFYYIALAERALGASGEDFLPRVFARLFLPVLYPGQCYRTAIAAVPDRAAVLVLVLAVLPALRLASEAAQEAWEHGEALPASVARVIFSEVPVWRAVPAW
jgi:hypothetical protein